MLKRKRLAACLPGSKKVAALAALSVAALASPGRAQTVPDMVSRTAFRVCEDSANMPFSDRKGEGFENKVADIVGSELKLPVRYFWAPSGPGFIRNTLQSGLCDIVIGYAAGAEIVQHTNPYYRSTYVIVALSDSPLAGVTSLDDPRLKGRHLGVFERTPPVDELVAKGLMADAKAYSLVVDHRFASPLGDLLTDLRNKTIDAAIVWGPLIGLDVKQANGALKMTPLLKQGNGPDYSYRITFGIRHNEPDWKHRLEAVIRARQTDINAVLNDYNIPLLDNSGQVIPPAATASAGKPVTP